MNKDKLEKELASIKEMGLDDYVKTRKAKINLLGVIGIAVAAFVLGAIIF